MPASPTPVRHLRLALAALFLLLAGVGLVPVIQGRATDFGVYLGAAARLRQGADLSAEGAPFLYPPLLAVLLVPALAVPKTAAAAGWAVLSAALITFAVARVARGSSAPLRTVAAACLFAPFAATQWNGQANGVVLALLVLARSLLDAERVEGGAALGFSAAIKPLTALPVIWLLLRRRRAGLGALAVLLLGFAAGLPFIGLEGLRRSASAVAEHLTGSWGETYGANVALAGAWMRGLGDRLPSALLALRIAIVGLSLWVAARRTARASASIDLLVAGSLLAANIAWLHHAAVVFPLAASLGLPALAAVVGLFAVAGAWRGVSASLGGAAGAAASAAGTAALALLWVSALRRCAAAPPETERPAGGRRAEGFEPGKSRR